MCNADQRASEAATAVFELVQLANISPGKLGASSAATQHPALV
jgi:hypothetical protein